jgi:uncharacterized membrane protein
MFTRDRDRVSSTLRDTLNYLDDLARDKQLRSDLGSAVGHGIVAFQRARTGSGLSGLGDKVAGDRKLRKNLQALSHDLDSAGTRVRRSGTHRLRNTLLVLALGGTVAAVAPRLLRVFSGRRSTATGSSDGVGVVEETIEVNVPVSAAYNQWTQFEEFPRFMEGVEEVRQLDDTLLHWAATVSGKRREWEARITEQLPDRRIAWRSVTGTQTSGSVSFEPAGQDRTRVRVEMSYRPGVLDRVGSLIGLDNRRVRGDLERFKELIESRGTETGAWRGEVHGATRTN